MLDWAERLWQKANSGGWTAGSKHLRNSGSCNVFQVCREYHERSKEGHLLNQQQGQPFPLCVRSKPYSLSSWKTETQTASGSGKQRELTEHPPGFRHHSTQEGIAANWPMLRRWAGWLVDGKDRSPGMTRWQLFKVLTMVDSDCRATLSSLSLVHPSGSLIKEEVEIWFERYRLLVSEPLFL